MTAELQNFTEAAICQTCGQPFTAKCFIIPIASKPFKPRHCESCSAQLDAKIKAEDTERARINHSIEWQRVCPLEFRTIAEGGRTDIERLKRDQPLYGEAMKWKRGRRGLLMLGGTGAGKTRIAWRLLRRELDADRKFIAIKAHQFGLMAVELQTGSGFESWLHELKHTPLLFIDDFGKGRFSDAVESHVFALIDERTENGRPMIITTNSNSEELMARMSADRGEPTMRRLKDYCDIVDFNA